MKIELTTTKTKLTKSFVNQMRTAPDNAIKHGKVLGFMVNVVKSIHRAVLIEHMANYYIFSMAWEKSEIAVYRMVGKNSYTKKFDGAEACDEWWEVYQNMRLKADTQIYI